MQGSRCLVVGHRGSPRTHLENTPASFDRALAVGADGLEMDLLFHDGRPHVAHDLPVPATAPALSEVLDDIAGRVHRIYLHYKAANRRLADRDTHIACIEQEVARSDLYDVVVVMVEDGDVAPWRKRAPRLQVLQCWTAPRARPRRVTLEEAARHGLDHVGVYHSPKQYSLVGRACNRLGFPRLAALVGFGPLRRLARRHKGHVVVFTVNDPHLMRRYAAAGFDAIGTDDPELGRRVLGRPSMPHASEGAA